MTGDEFRSLVGTVKKTMNEEGEIMYKVEKQENFQ